MKDGEVLEAGPVAQVLEQPKHPYTRTLVEAQHGFTDSGM
jgi:ABC-type dipeptide/oligopeptide/nickel transport system ATPase component